MPKEDGKRQPFRYVLLALAVAGLPATVGIGIGLGIGRIGAPASWAALQAGGGLMALSGAAIVAGYF
jgi:hypothetical protein